MANARDRSRSPHTVEELREELAVSAFITHTMERGLDMMHNRVDRLKAEKEELEGLV